MISFCLWLFFGIELRPDRDEEYLEIMRKELEEAARARRAA